MDENNLSSGPLSKGQIFTGTWALATVGLLLFQGRNWGVNRPVYLATLKHFYLCQTNLPDSCSIYDQAMRVQEISEAIHRVYLAPAAGALLALLVTLFFVFLRRDHDA